MFYLHPDSKVDGVKMGLIWGRQDPGGPHVGPMNFAIWAVLLCYTHISCYAPLCCKMTWLYIELEMHD